MKLIIEIDDDQIPVLEKVHGDVAVWLKSIIDKQLVKANRIDAQAGIQQLIEKDAEFVASVAELARASPDFKSPRIKDRSVAEIETKEKEPVDVISEADSARIEK